MKKVLFILLAVVLILACVVITIFAAFDMTRPVAVMKGMAGIDTMPEYADANGDGKVNVLDVILLMREDNGLGGVYLTELTLDDANYSLEFDQKKFTYYVDLPAGRPTIPQVEAKADEGITVKVYQAYIPDGETEGKATVDVSVDGRSNTYTVNFKRDSKNGFVLQYDDRYMLPIAQEGYIYSSDSEALVVDKDGLMTAKAVTDTPITVTATKGNDTKTFTVNKIEKAHINLFFVTGQSNGQGCYDGVTVDGEGTLEKPNQIFYNVQLDTVIRPDEKGKVYSFDVHPRSENIRYYKDPAFQANVIYDMHDFSRQGFASPLGVDWYNYTGEKVIFLQSAWSGSSIESWINPETHAAESGKYSGQKLNFYETTKAGYNTLVGLLEDNYEIVRTMNFWFQGETATNAVYDKTISDYHFSDDSTFDPKKLMTDETYYKYFKWIDEDMRREMGLEYNGILSIRSHGAKTRQTIVPIISAQFALCNENDGIFLAMRKVMEITRQFVDPDTTSDGWNFMGTDNNHYNQIGYNRVGAEAAENAFNFAFRPVNKKATGIEIIDNDGKTRLEDNATLELQAGTVYRLGVLSLPHYTSEKVTFETTNPNIAYVDKYNAIYAMSAGSAKLTVTTESGHSKSINVVVYEIDTERVEYRWDFKDLTSTTGDNDLRISTAAKALGLEKGYTLTGGVYKNNSTTAAKRPDFKAEKPMYIDSLHDWTIEWASALNSNSTLLGPDSTDHTNADEMFGYLYLSHAAYKKIKFVPEVGKAIFLDYGQYLDKATEMNCWRIEYTASDNMLRLKISLDEGTTWNDVSTAVGGEFSTTFTNIFGRAYGTGKIAFTGECDYIKINCHTATKVYERELTPTYRWDFNDLTSTIGDNELSPSDATVYHNAQNNFKILDGKYIVEYDDIKSAYTQRPDLKIEKPFVLSSDKDWEIQWKCKQVDKGDGTVHASLLMGGTPADPADTTTTEWGYIYIAPGTDFGEKGYPVKFAFSSSYSQDFVEYKEYRTMANEMNSWKLVYDAETKMVTLYASRNDGGIWMKADSELLANFNMEISTLFGRMYGNGKYNFIGEMDYIQVSLGE